MIDTNMKSQRKAYSKPLVTVEDFTLNQFISSCAVQTRNKEREEWMAELQVYSPFAYTVIKNTNQFADPVGCEIHADQHMDTLCYHTSTSPLFTS